MATVIGKRRKAREAALQFLLQEDFLQDEYLPLALPAGRRLFFAPPIPFLWHEFSAEKLPQRFTRFCDHFTIGVAARAYALSLVAECRARVGRIDSLIEQSATNWRLSRIAAVDRNVLRLAVCEMLVEGAPDQVVINEAVDIAKRFAALDSPSFVNGVLDAVRVSLRGA